MHEKTLKSKNIFQGRIINVREDEVELATGIVSHREIVEHPGAVAVVALTDKNEIVLIRQFRKPTEKVLIEIPAGLFNKGEDLDAAASRELKEETGYSAGKIEHAVSIYTSPGYSTELLHIFIATGLKLGRQNYEQDEHIEVELMPIQKAEDMVKEGKIQDGKTIVGIYLAKKICNNTSKNL